MNLAGPMLFWSSRNAFHDARSNRMTRSIEVLDWSKRAQRLEQGRYSKQPQSLKSKPKDDAQSSVQK